MAAESNPTATTEVVQGITVTGISTETAQAMESRLKKSIEDHCVTIQNVVLSGVNANIENKYNEQSAELLQRRLEDDENLNFDMLLRYVINPWSAFYIGYNSNQSNFDIVEMEGERELVVANNLRQDGDQFFVKFSYLFQR